MIRPSKLTHSVFLIKNKCRH